MCSHCRTWPLSYDPRIPAMLGRDTSGFTDLVDTKCREVCGGGGFRARQSLCINVMIMKKTHPHSRSILQVPTTQLAKVSIDPKFVERTADVLEIFLYNGLRGTNLAYFIKSGNRVCIICFSHTLAKVNIFML